MAAQEALSAPGRLFTLSYSHYCELARWALLKPASGQPIPFREEALPLGIHRKVVAPYRVGHDRKTSMPVFVSGDGNKILLTSMDVLEYAGWQIDEEFRELLDETLGPAARRVAYHYVLQRDGMLRELQYYGTSWLHWLMFCGLWLTMDLPERLRTVLKIKDGYTPEEDIAIIDQVFREVEHRLAGGAEYLGEGGKFGGPDIAFASLAAPIVWFTDTQYANGILSRYTLDLLPAGFDATVNRFRDTVAGRHIKKVYDEHRPQVK